MRNKSKIILGNDPSEAQLRFNKIIGFFTHVYYYRYHRKQEYGEEKSCEKLFEYIPVDFFHDLYKDAQKNTSIQILLPTPNAKAKRE